MFLPVFLLVLLALCASGVAWWWGGALAAALAALVVISVAALLVWVRAWRLERWLADPSLAKDPGFGGLHRDIALRMQRLLRLRDKAVQLHEQRLKYFLQAIQASPNGVILLDEQGRIEWCNVTASNHLGLDVSRDLMQHIVHLVRDPVFARYFVQSEHAQEVVIEGRSPSLSHSVKLSVQLHAYGEGRQLLLTRDITAVAMAEAMRRDFVANVSHEIRTPLTVLNGFVETLQSLPLDDAQRQQYLGLMAVQSARMQTLVDDLLTLSQLEGRLPPGLSEQVPLPEFMTQLASEARALSAVIAGPDALQGHDLVFEETPDWLLLGSRTELFSAVSNLVSNAVRYTPVGGRIEVRWTRQDEHVVFAVTDSGPGIAPEHLPRLSERFYRVDRSRSRETGGTGLGLAIAKHVAQRHGGELRIESQLGKGSTFKLLFPLSRCVMNG